MGYSLAIGSTLVQLPQSRAVVPQSTRQPPRVQEILGTARVIRQDEGAARPQSRTSRRGDGHLASDTPDSNRNAALTFHRRPDPAPRTFSHLSAPGASTTFAAQLLGQASTRDEDRFPPHHRDGAELGSVAYRRAGGEPTIYSSEAALIRIAV